VPIVRGLDAQLALRYDDYSDFGSTTNPKIALRWQPLQELLLRASWGTGFRAPPLYSLYRPAYSELPLNNVSDPVRCPVTGLPADCRTTLEVTSGGNPDLQPETSTQWNAGIVWQPAPGLSIGIDYWNIDLDDRITGLSPTVALQYYDTYSDRFIRGPVDPATPDLPGPLIGVQTSEVNLGRTKTSGIDVNLDWTSPAADWGTVQVALQGTYVTNWETTLNGVTMVSMLGTDAFVAVVPRWRSLFTLGWNRGAWGATLAQNYTHGYTDFRPGLDGQPRRVGAYALWDLQGTYAASVNWRFAAGVKNLLDAEPPATNKPAGFFPGYNPLLTNPLGRLFYLRATVSWR
jgi:iron complex outermembrane receptor protein